MLRSRTLQDDLYTYTQTSLIHDQLLSLMSDNAFLEALQLLKQNEHLPFHLVALNTNNNPNIGYPIGYTMLSRIVCAEDFGDMTKIILSWNIKDDTDEYYGYALLHAISNVRSKIAAHLCELVPLRVSLQHLIEANNICLY